MSDNDRILLFPDLKPRKGIDYANRHLLRMEAAGRFPARFALTTRANGMPGRVAWLESEIDEWIKQRAAQRGPQRAA